MPRRILLLSFAAVLCASFGLAQMPTPPPSPSPTPIPTWPPPNFGYGCTDDAGNWYPEGGTRTETTNPDLQNGKKDVTETYRCFHGTWALQMRVTNWNSKTGDPGAAGGEQSEGGNRTEWFDYTTGCMTFSDEHRNTLTRTNVPGGIQEDAHCYWTMKGNSCTTPPSTYDQRTERYSTSTIFGNTRLFSKAGYEETSDSIGYDPTGKLVQDSHDHYKRVKTSRSNAFPSGNVFCAFEVVYWQEGATIPHPMSYSARFLLGGGGDGEDVWSATAQFPQYDAFGNFTGYAGATSVGQILTQAKGREFLPACGGDDGDWVWNPAEPGQDPFGFIPPPR